MRFKEKVKSDLISENRQKIKRISLAIFIIVLIISVLCIKKYSNKKEPKGISYTDKQSIEYKVALKSNKYYEDEYIEENNQYISSLIDNIETKFNYDFKVEDKSITNYKYKIITDVDVKDNKTAKSIYSFSEETVPEKTAKITNGTFKINESINLDYGKYDNLIKEFVTVYNLTNSTSKATISLIIGVEGKEFSNKTIPVMSLDIPLGLNTISIDTNYNLAGNNHTIALTPNTGNTKMWLTAGITLAILDVLAFITCTIILNVNKTSEDRYDDEIKKIMNNYESYISKIDSKFDVEGYQVLRVEKFVDLLEIRDTMQLPIIMLENKNLKLTCFYIATENNLLYFYSISVKQYAALPRGKGEEQYS